MNDKLKRVFLSLKSAVLAIGLVCLLLTLSVVWRSRWESWDVKGFLSFFCYAFIVIGWLGLPGWILALPAVLAFTNPKGWRFWALLALGTAIGPFAFCMEVLWSGGGHRIPAATDWLGLALAGTVSASAALIYLLVLRRIEREDKKNSA